MALPPQIRKVRGAPRVRGAAGPVTPRGCSREVGSSLRGSHAHAQRVMRALAVHPAPQALPWHKAGYFLGFGAVLAVLYYTPESVLFPRVRATDSSARSAGVEASLWLAVVRGTVRASGDDAVT